MTTYAKSMSELRVAVVCSDTLNKNEFFFYVGGVVNLREHVLYSRYLHWYHAASVVPTRNRGREEREGMERQGC